MLAGLALLAAISAPPPDVSFVHAASYDPNTQNYSWAGVSLGAEASDRYILVAALTEANDGSKDITGLTINGVAATNIAKQASASAYGVCSLWGALVPTGTSVTLTMTTNATQNFATIIVMRVTGLQSLAPVSSQNDTTLPYQTSMSLPAGSVLIEVGQLYRTDTVTFSGFASTSRLDIGAVGVVRADAETIASVSITGTSTTTLTAAVSVVLR